MRGRLDDRRATVRRGAGPVRDAARADAEAGRTSEAAPADTSGCRAATPRVVVSASLDKLRSADVRFLQEASRAGSVHLRLPSDAAVEAATGSPPAFPLAERRFLAASLRPVESVAVVRRPPAAALADLAVGIGALVVAPSDDEPGLRDRCRARGIGYRVIDPDGLAGFPPFDDETSAAPSGAGRVVVSGCFDWLHSGHIRFFLDAAAFGELHVVVGSDRNVRLLKGRGHPLQGQAERRYMVQAVRCVRRCHISSGDGWLDAEPEIAAIEPAVYVVNEDGDQPEKRDFCRAHGIEYVVLERRPHRDLPRRTSTELRGF